MKIAIASLGKDANSEISPQAGRAPYYLIFEDGELVEVWKNVFSVGGGGVGLAIAKIMGDKNVEKIISANFGEKIKEALKEKGIDFAIKTGVIKDIV
ncbi:MAG: NifB/NifX family molybdenum-iron cluster-binding protein [Candidatus Komeilibacteria bacterium]